MRFADGDRAVVCVDEPGQTEVLQGHGDAVVVRHNGEGLALLDPMFRA